MSALVFLDTETTGLSLKDDIWEFAAIRREPDGSERELHLFIEHDSNKCARLPDSFREDHERRFPAQCSGLIAPRAEACQQIRDLFREGEGKPPHVVGAVPNFDTDRIERMIAAEWPRWPSSNPGWHYHLIDVENLAVGYLHGLLSTREGYLESIGNYKNPTLPWDSNEVSLAVGVDPEQFERHTAMSDVRWAMAIYDAITKSSRAS